MSSIENETMSEETGRTLQDYLFTNAMKGNWKNVVEKYSKDPRAHEVEITKSKDTALHLAVFDNQEEIVSELIHHICNFNNKKVVEKQNERKNTALHIAASLGNVRMCKDIGSVNPNLVDIRNGEGETPLFLAALNGHKNAFLCLHSFCRSNLTRVNANSRRTNGDSVLHCAIKNEHFDLAFQIIELNKEIVNLVNGEGLTPLHLLASKPTAFKSGCRNVGRWKKVIYHCTFVDPLKSESGSCCQPNSLNMMTKLPKKPPYPDNYKTCIRFFQIFWEGFLVVSNWKRALNKKKNLKNEETKKRILKKNHPQKDEAMDETNLEDEEIVDTERNSDPNKEIFPENYITCINIVKNFCKAIIIILGFGSIEFRKLREKKEKHVWSIQMMEKLLELASLYKYDHDGNTPLTTRLQPDDDTTETRPYILSDNGVGFGNVTDEPLQVKHENIKERRENKLKETPVLMAAKNGVVEMVKRILELFPVAIHDMNLEKKNVVLLAAENRQPDVYKFLLENKFEKESVFRKIDHKGNSVLHLAANLSAHKPWRIAGSALQMEWELKWYQFVKDSMPLHFFVRYNDEGKIPKHIFHETHNELADGSRKWLTKTSKSCSVVAALIATVAFATSATVPGGNQEKVGIPVLKNTTSFQVYAVFSLVALCFSVTSMVMFLAVLTSRYDERDLKSSLPWKLLLGLSSLFLSIVTMLVSFCSGHFFVLNDELQKIAIPLYTIVCFPVTLFVLGHFPLYFDLLQAIIWKIPQRSSKSILSS